MPIKFKQMHTTSSYKKIQQTKRIQENSLKYVWCINKSLNFLSKNNRKYVWRHVYDIMI